MKKILFIASDNNSSSGAFRSMVQLCDILNKSCDYKIIVVLPKKGDGISLLQEKKIEYVVIRSYSWIVNIAEKDKVYVKVFMLIKRLLNFVSIFRICRLIYLKKIDIVHINTIWSYVGAKAALATNRKLVWHIREAIELQQNKCFFRENDYSLINRADSIICISDFIRDYYSTKIKVNKVSVIYNGVDAGQFYLGDRTILVSDIVKILNIGHMNSNKKQEDVIAAAKKLLDDGITNFHISFVGTGRKESMFKDMCKKLGLEQYISFYGAQKDIIKFYKNNDVLVTSGDYEAFGRTTIEGMMAGCFIIGSDTGATSKLLENEKYGFLYDPLNTMDLYLKFKRLLLSDVNEIREVAECGQKYALDHYSAEKNALEVRKVYKRL